MEEVQNEKCKELFEEITITSFERNKKEILFRESTKQTCADMARKWDNGFYEATQTNNVENVMLQSTHEDGGWNQVSLFSGVKELQTDWRVSYVTTSCRQ